MKRKTIIWIGLMLATLLLAAVAAVAAGQGHHDLAPSRRFMTSDDADVRYSITDLGTLGGRSSRALAINENAQVVGYRQAADLSFRAFHWEDDVMTELSTPDDFDSFAFDIDDAGRTVGQLRSSGGELQYVAVSWQDGARAAIDSGMSSAAALNESGQIAGSIFNGEDAELDQQAVIWQGSGKTVLGTLGETWNGALAINENGEIVGNYDSEGDSASIVRAFLWANGNMVDLGVAPAGQFTDAVDINDAGDIVGGRMTADGLRAYLRKADGTVIDLGTIGGGSSRGLAINNAGQVVGNAGASAFLWENDTLSDLNDLVDPESGWILQSAEDINDAGQIVGYGIYEGQTRAFLLTPDVWTVMFYLAADNDLSNTYSPIFNQLELAADNPNVNIIVLWDGPEEGDAAYYHVQHDLNFDTLADYVEGETMWGQGEVDMGFPTTLSDFATWAMTEFPAQHYGLVLDDHGSGLGGGLVDDTSGSKMNLPEMKLALATIHEQTEQKIDVLYMAMCLMGMIEDAYQFRGHVDYYIASEHLQWAFYVPYYKYVDGIAGSSTPAEVAQLFADSYADVADGRDKPFTISVVDMAQLDPLATATQQLGGELDWYMEEISPTVTAVLTDVQRFDNRAPHNDITTGDTAIDLYHFADLASLNLLEYGDIVIAATAVMSAVDDAVIYERHRSSASTDLDNSHGIAIFFPSNPSSFYHPDNYDFAVGANWDDVNAEAEGPTTTAGAGSWGAMLVNYIQQVNPEGTDDPAPPPPLPKLLPEDSLFLPLIVR